MSLSLTQLVHQNVQMRPHSVATDFGGREYTWSQFMDRVARLAGGLRTLGVKPGDRVGILSLNSDRYLEMYFAIWWAGAAVNPINTRWAAPEIAFSLDDCDTRIVFIDDTFIAMKENLNKLSPALKTLIHATDGDSAGGTVGYEGLIADNAPVADAESSGDTLAGVFYTGGTTGRPKGVMLSHTNLVLNGLLLHAVCPMNASAISLHSLPLFHLAGLSFLFRAVMQGCRMIIHPSFVPKAVLNAIDRQKVSHLVLVPTMLQMLADSPEVAGCDTSSVVVVGYGASPISEAVLERAMKVFPNAGFFQGYGMTEVSAGLTCLIDTDHRIGDPRGRMRSAGQALPTCDVKIVDPEGRTLPPGEAGEIVARSACVMQGYWNRPEETSAALRDGWMHTGDMGRLDEEGYLFIVDRVKDMIVSGGENVYSVEVENALAKHPAVASVAVIGIPHERWGEQVHAVIVRAPGATASADELQAHCKTLIATYKCPRSIEFIGTMPISGAGKILKTDLRKPYWEGRSAGVA